LRDDPVFQLLEPGSVQLALRGGDVSWSPEGQNDAFAEKIVGSRTPVDEVVRFYRVELENDGWAEGRTEGRAGVCSYQNPKTSWTKGDLTLSIAFLSELPTSFQDVDKHCLLYLPETAFAEYATLYEVFLSYNPDRSIGS
jgi:hypothetical protein